MAEYSISPRATPISGQVFKAGPPIAAYNNIGSNLVPTTPASRPRMGPTGDIVCYGDVGSSSPAAPNANRASGSSLPKEGQPVSSKHNIQTALNSPPLVKNKRRKPLSDQYSLTYPQETAGDYNLALALHVRQHRSVPMTHLIATT
jgi:hypothetical protein